MSDKWAYTQLGRLRNHDIWNHFGPGDPNKRDRNLSALFDAARDTFHGEKTLETGINTIGLDGEKWFIGRVALPSAVLDPDKYPPKLYARDLANRGAVHFHGYTSEGINFPETLPLVDHAHFKEMHEKNILPLWEKSLNNQKAEFDRKITPFSSPHNEIAITEHLPEEAVSILREAHTKGERIALHYDPAQKTWSKADKFTDHFKREERIAAERAAKETSKSTTSSVIKTTENAAEKTAQSWTSKLSKVWEHPGGKFAIIGGTVALGGLIGYWAFKTKSEKAQNDQAASRN